MHHECDCIESKGQQAVQYASDSHKNLYVERSVAYNDWAFSIFSHLAFQIVQLTRITNSRDNIRDGPNSLFAIYSRHMLCKTLFVQYSTG